MSNATVLSTYIALTADYSHHVYFCTVALIVEHSEENKNVKPRQVQLRAPALSFAVIKSELRRLSSMPTQE